jgi:hypothetical protein
MLIYGMFPTCYSSKANPINVTKPNQRNLYYVKCVKRREKKDNQKASVEINQTVTSPQTYQH